MNSLTTGKVTFKDVAGLQGKGIVFNIQRYSLHDGSGIRTVIFLRVVHCGANGDQTLI